MKSSLNNCLEVYERYESGRQNLQLVLKCTFFAIQHLMLFIYVYTEHRAHGLTQPDWVLLGSGKSNNG